jgi:hypothetical protein
MIGDQNECRGRGLRIYCKSGFLSPYRLHHLFQPRFRRPRRIVGNIRIDHYDAVMLGDLEKALVELVADI